MDLSNLHILHGDCKQRLQEVPDNSVDLIVTSPPYAEQRKKQYDSTSESDYVEWFLPIAQELQRILKPTGSFLLNLNPHCRDGERSLYVYELVLALRNRVKFRYIDEYVWYKSASPRRKTFRLKDAWEPVFHFGKDYTLPDNPYVCHEKIKIRSSSTFVNKRGWVSLNSITGNMGGYHAICEQRPGFTDPDNVLYFPTSLLVKDKFEHPAKFPVELPRFFIRGFCPPDGTVCDPFLGSGSTLLAALIEKRKGIGIEISEEFCKMSQERLENYEPDVIRPPKGLKEYEVDIPIPQKTQDIA